MLSAFREIMNPNRNVGILSVCWIKYHAMKAYGSVEVSPHLF